MLPSQRKVGQSPVIASTNSTLVWTHGWLPNYHRRTKDRARERPIAAKKLAMSLPAHTTHVIGTTSMQTGGRAWIEPIRPTAMISTSSSVDGPRRQAVVGRPGLSLAAVSAVRSMGMERRSALARGRARETKKWTSRQARSRRPASGEKTWAAVAAGYREEARASLGR